MDSERLDRLARVMASATSRRGALRLFGGGALGAALAGAGRSASAANCANPCNCTSCNCVYYVRCKTGLSGGPASAAGYTQSAMKSRGYVKVNPRVGAIMVWDANKHGAYGDGHMAIVTSAGYSGGKWNITVKHTDWVKVCSETYTSFSWGNLDGVNSYVKG